MQIASIKGRQNPPLGEVGEQGPAGRTDHLDDPLVLSDGTGVRKDGRVAVPRPHGEPHDGAGVLQDEEGEPMDLRVVVFVIVPVDVTMEEERTANSEEVKELLVVHREMEDEGGPKPPFEKPINPVPPKPDILRILEKPAVLFALGEDDPSRLGHRLGQVEQLRDSVPASPSPLVDEDLRDGGGAGRLRARGLQGRRGSSQQKRLKPGPDGSLVIIPSPLSTTCGPCR